VQNQSDADCPSASDRGDRPGQHHVEPPAHIAWYAVRPPLYREQTGSRKLKLNLSGPARIDRVFFADG
jgi:hypothetical protein